MPSPPHAVALSRPLLLGLALVFAGVDPTAATGPARVRSYTGPAIGASLRGPVPAVSRRGGLPYRRAAPRLRRGSLLLIDNPYGGYVTLPLPLMAPPPCPPPPAPEPAAPAPPRPYGDYFPLGPEAPAPGTERATLPDDSVEMLLGGTLYRQHERALYRPRKGGGWVVVEPPGLNSAVSGR